MKEKEYVQVTDSCSGITGFGPAGSPLRAKSPCCHQLNYKLAIVTTTADTGTVATGATVITGTVTMSGAATAGADMIMAWHRGWYKNNAYERGYREGWNDRDDRRGGWGHGGRGHGGHGHHH